MSCTSVPRADSHLASIYRKLQVTSRGELVAPQIAYTASCPTQGVVLNSHEPTRQTRPARFEATRLGRIAFAAFVLALAGCGSAAGSNSATTTSPAVGKSCSPQPCGSNGGLDVHVTGLVHVPTAPGLVEATFTVTNNDTKAHELNGALDTYELQPGNESAITDLDASSLGYLADGSACQSDQASLPPGTTSPTLHTCFTLTDAQLAEPLKFLWSITNDSYSSTGTIDLAGMRMQ